MTNKKGTKRALLSSVIALILCFSMLLGTSYAWFTDSVTSANNIIQSGNLDVELEYAKVDGDGHTEWATVQDAEAIFDLDALWEPGRVEVVYLKVSNLGSLALKYQLGVNVVDEIVGKNVAGEEFKLSDHLVFKVVEMPDSITTYTDREAVVLAAGTEKGLKDYNGSTTALEVGGVDYVALIVYMPESVGNEANYRSEEIPTITLGVNLYATQLMAEEDSFGKDYDEDAWVTGMTVHNVEEFKNALAIGSSVILANDIDLSGEAWTPVETFSGTLDGNGYTIKNLTITDAAKGGLFKSLAEGAVIKNVKFENVSATGTQAAAIANSATGATIEGVEVLSGSIAVTDYGAGIVVVADKTTIKNCVNKATITSDFSASGIGAWVTNSAVEGCTNYGDVTGANRAGGICANFSGTMSACTNEGSVVSNGSMPAGGIIGVLSGAATITDCTNSGDVTNNGTNEYNSSAAGILAQTPSAKATIKNCVNTGKITAVSSVAAGIGVSLYGGITATGCSNSGEISGLTVKQAESVAIVSAKGMFGGSNTIN